VRDGNSKAWAKFVALKSVVHYERAREEEGIGKIGG